MLRIPSIFLTLVHLFFTYGVDATIDAVDYQPHDSCPSLMMFDSIEEYQRSKNVNNGEEPGYRVFLTDEAAKHGAYCLDGSIPDFYYRAGTGDGIHKYIIYLQGGGWCVGLDNCAQRAGTNLGTTKYDSSVANIAAGAPYLSSNKSINPLTYNWNTIYARYCDGSCFSSNNETIYQYNSTLSLYFRGFRILNGIFNVLLQNYSFYLATDVILTGCSAGGLGVYFHSDYVYQLIARLKTNHGFNYMSMPDAGYFMQTDFDIKTMQFNWYYGNITMALNDKCVNYYYNISQNKDDIKQCMYAANIAPFIDTRMFALQSQYDSNQIADLGPQKDNVTFINIYGKNLTKYYIENYINTNDNHFGWLVSCFEHCIFGVEQWNQITINGYTTAQAQINAYYYNDTQNRFLFQNQTYPCDSCCD